MQSSPKSSLSPTNARPHSCLLTGIIALLAVLAVSLNACRHFDGKNGDGSILRADSHGDPALPETLAQNEGVLMVVGTNDIHGGLLPDVAGGQAKGGMALIAGHLSALRQHVNSHYGMRGKVLLLDAGDAIQGTLLSNLSEGILMARIFGLLGYDAVIAGNHGFDFGPVDAKEDRCLPSMGTSCDPLAALKAAVALSGTPWLGSNVLERTTGRPPAFLKPYVLVPFMGRNIAVFGLEDQATPKTTLAANVATLSFGETETVEMTIQALWNAGDADLFVAAIHGGDGRDDKKFREELERLPAGPGGRPLFDAVVAGHTHQHNEDISGNGIPYMQSRSGGRYYGAMRLIVATGSDGRLVVRRERTKFKASISADRGSTLWGEAVEEDGELAAELANAQATVAEVADRKIGRALGALDRGDGRRDPTIVGSFLVDAMRARAATSAAIINFGDVRADLKAGDIRYEDLFKIIPKNLKLVVLPEAPVDLLARNFKRAIRSCGARGILETSGVKAVFRRTCVPGQVEDRAARLLKLVDSEGTVIWEDVGTGPQVLANTGCPDEDAPCPACVKQASISLATTDFVALDGGAGYCHLVSTAVGPLIKDLKDEVIEWLATTGPIAPSMFDSSRYVNCAVPSAASTDDCL